jgi:DNA-binding MarR family transcriptional regulator
VGRKPTQIRAVQARRLDVDSTTDRLLLAAYMIFQVVRAGSVMSRAISKQERLNELVEAFTELGPAWVRWVNACLPGDAVSYARMRLLAALQCDGESTMGGLATALGVTPRRITVLVEALEADGLVERHAHPTDGRSTVVTITESGLRQQELGWRRHQGEVGLAFGDLSEDQQVQLLTISRALTDAMLGRLAERSSPHLDGCEPQARHTRGVELLEGSRARS